MYGSLTERITRSLAYMLRHQPDEFDLELDKEGYGDLEDVVCALNERLGEPIDAEDVVEAIGSGDRQRYEVVDDRIRALYGHSFPVEPGESVEPPEELYVGLGSRDADRARRHGLDSGRRAFLHLARTWDEAREMGRRAAPEYAVITVQALDAWEDGIDFYDRRSLFLSESIPTEFLEISEVFDDGVRREGRGGDRRRGGRDGGRGRGRGRRGGRRDGRGEGGRRDEGRRDSLREEPRREEPRREEPRREEPRREEPARSSRAPEPREERPRTVEREEVAASESSSREDAGGFGAGLLEAKAPRGRADRGKQQAAPQRAEVARDPEPEPEPRAEPARVEEPAQDSDAGGFGAGIL